MPKRIRRTPQARTIGTWGVVRSDGLIFVRGTTQRRALRMVRELNAAPPQAGHVVTYTARDLRGIRPEKVRVT